MINPKPQVLRALSNLRGSDDFMEVLEWIDDTINSKKDALVVSDVAGVPELQGEARILASLVAGYKGAPLTLDKLLTKRNT